jgi:hypothetical protein
VGSRRTFTIPRGVKSDIVPVAWCNMLGTERLLSWSQLLPVAPQGRLHAGTLVLSRVSKFH